MDRNSGKTVKRVHTDSAKEFLVMRRNLKSIEIVHTTTSVHTPEFNGLAERMYRTLLDKVRTMLNEAVMLNSF